MIRSVKFFSATLLSAIMLTTAHAQTTYPNRPIRVVVPFAPGGPTDAAMRIVAPRFSEYLGQQIIIENRGGAGGATGTELVAKAAPDGYTLVHGSIGGLAVSPTMNPKLGYNVTLHPSVPARSMKELIALARARSGKLNYGSGGAGTGPHLAGELLNMMAGVKIVHVPYKGTGPALTALLSGEVDLTFDNLLIVLPQIKAGRVRPIAATGDTRSKLMPDLPTIAESGFPGFSASGWYGLLAPAATPKDIVTRLNADFTRALRSPDVNERLNSMAAEPAPGTPEQFAAFIRSETEKWAKVVRATNMKAE
jgi:tripartite-type tricarboxylate transporter receptor subunit TctC